MPRVTGLFVYPVKSLRGHSLSVADFDALGFVGDRRFLVTDATGKFITQRTVPRMAQIETSLSADQLVLSAAKAGQVTVSRSSQPHAPLRSVCVWNSENLQAEDCGVAASTWLSDFLGLQCHLVRIGQAFHRPIIKPSAQPGDAVSFADAYPFLLIGEASLADLNDRIQENQGEAVPMNRFRPSIVMEGSEPFAEDHWTRFRIGNAIFRHGSLSARCIVTTTDQYTGERLGKEPLRTLATFRRDAKDPSDVNFGANLIHETKQGTLLIGDTVTFL